MAAAPANSNGSKTISITEVFDNSKFTTYQFGVCFLCFLVTFLDGFDLTVIGVALPKLAAFLKAKPSSLGIALAAGQFGPLIGAIVLGSLADKWGRKWMLCFSAMIFGVFTVMTAFITSVEQLALYRFLAGLGLGGAVPNALAFGSEYAPSRMRSTLTTCMYAGMSGGATAGSLAAVFLLPYYDWQSLFLVGGIAPIAIGILVAVALPESLEFLARKGKAENRIRTIIGKIAPDLAKDKAVQFIPTGAKLKGIPVKHLFADGRAIITVLLWISLIGALYSLWVLTSWAPTLLHKTGATVRQYSLAFACLHFGAFLATVSIGRFMDKFNPFWVLTIGFTTGFVCLSAFGFFAGGSFLVIAALSVLCGMFINGSNAGLLAVATISYPPAIRGSGIGWAYAVAKVGAMLAPAVGGVMLSMNWSTASICYVNALVGLFVAGFVLILKRRVTASERETAQKAVDYDDMNVSEAEVA